MFLYVTLALGKLNCTDNKSLLSMAGNYENHKVQILWEDHKIWRKSKQSGSFFQNCVAFSGHMNLILNTTYTKMRQSHLLIPNPGPSTILETFDQTIHGHGHNILVKPMKKIQIWTELNPWAHPRGNHYFYLENKYSCMS